MPRQLTVLGSQAAYPTLGSPCSGFLLAWDALTIVLDLGYGTLQPLLARVAQPRDIDAIIITHEHPDHWLDLHALLRLLYYGPPLSPPAGPAGPSQQQRGEDKQRKLSLYCTRGVIEQLIHLEPDLPVHTISDVHILSHGCAFAISASLRLKGFLLPHWVPNIGIRLSVIPDQGEAQDNGTYSGTPDDGDTPLLAYTGDTGPSPLLAELGRGVRVFIVDATDRPGETDKAPSERNLLTATEAGDWAAKAQCHSLLLTHFWPGNDKAAAVARAQSPFDGEVIAAEPGGVLDLST